MKKPTVIVICGPTASGKTALSIELAKKINGEIISSDSMQIYKYMDIGTAKPSEEEKEGIQHYLLDFVEPNQRYSVAEFKKDAESAIEEILAKGKTPIVVGGTGLYVDSLIYGIEYQDIELDEKYRKELDPEAAQRIHKNNTKRVIRALEVCLSGEKMNDFSNDLKINEKYKPIIIVLNREREHLYERINKRVDIMMESGLIDEVKKLLEMGYTKDMISMQGIGYKEIIKYLDGEYTLDEAVDIIKRASRRYAKRQLTWFRRYDDAKW